MDDEQLRQVIRDEMRREESRRMDARHRAQDKENHETGRLICWLVVIAVLVNVILAATGWDKYIP